MTAKFHGKTQKGMFIIILFIVLIFQTLLAGAQAYRGQSENLYRGFVTSFATRSADLSSSIGKLNQTSLTLAGGQVGLTLGNSVVRSKIGLFGYYSSTGNTAGTVDLYQSNWAANFYPLAMISRKSLIIEPYITGGLDYDQYKFYGYYINRESGEINYSQAEAPYLGKIKQINATVGAGIEVKLKDSYNFIHLFSEVRYGKNLSSKSTNATFSNTQIAGQMHVVVGITFGAH